MQPMCSHALWSVYSCLSGQGVATADVDDAEPSRNFASTSAYFTGSGFLPSASINCAVVPMTTVCPQVVPFPSLDNFFDAHDVLSGMQEVKETCEVVLKDVHLDTDFEEFFDTPGVFRGMQAVEETSEVGLASLSDPDFDEFFDAGAVLSEMQEVEETPEVGLASLRP